MINSKEVVPDCRQANCRHLLYTGRCLAECLRRYKGELVVSNHAFWRHRGAYNDFIWVECSNCGFREEGYKAVVKDGCDTKFKDVKYKFCPMCGKEMRV